MRSAIVYIPSLSDILIGLLTLSVMLEEMNHRQVC